MLKRTTNSTISFQQIQETLTTLSLAYDFFKKQLKISVKL